MSTWARRLFTVRLTVRIRAMPMMVETPMKSTKAKTRVERRPWPNWASIWARLMSTSSTPSTLRCGEWAWQGGARAAGLVIDGLDGAQHGLPGGGVERAGALALGQSLQGLVLGMAAVAGLGLFIHRGARLAGLGGIGDQSLGVHDAHPLDARLLGHVVEGVVEVPSLLGQHGAEHGAMQGLGEAHPMLAHQGHHLLALVLHIEIGGQAHRQEDDQPHRQG